MSHPDARRYEELQALFHEIRESSPVERARRLLDIKSDSPERWAELCALLAHDDEDFLAQPLVRPRASGWSTVALEAIEEDVPERIGPYRVLQLIGEGGYGLVYMAQQTAPLRREVAIKVIKPGMDSRTVLARFEAERQALAMLQHPSVASVIDAGQTDAGQPYFVMELVRGHPIDQFCVENDLGLTERLRLFQQVCLALQHAHQKGILHRDLKPGNILVTVESGQPRAKVIDFGIAKALHAPLTDRTLFTEYGQVVGTLEYMSPEQATATATGIDARSDIYSLGVVLYLLITGETPLSKRVLLEKGIWELREVLQHRMPATPSVLLTSPRPGKRFRDASAAPPWLRDVRGDLDWVTMKALAKDPESRYDSAKELAADLDRFLHGAPVVARPPDWFYVTRKFLARHRVAAILTASICVAGVVAALALVWGYWKSQENLAVAQQARRLAQQRADALDLSLREVQAQKTRADQYAQDLTGMLQRQMLETSWRAAMDGEYSTVKQKLSPNAAPISDWVLRVATSMRLPMLRTAEQGPIRTMALHAATGTFAVVTTTAQLEIGSTQTDLHRDHGDASITSIALPQGIYSTLAFDDSGSRILVGYGDSVALVSPESRECHAPLRLLRGGIRRIVHDAYRDQWLVTTGANDLVVVDAQATRIEATHRFSRRIGPVSVVSEDLACVGDLGGKLHVVRLPLDGTTVATSVAAEAIAEVWAWGDQCVLGTLEGGLTRLTPMAKETSSESISPERAFSQTPLTPLPSRPQVMAFSEAQQSGAPPAGAVLVAGYRDGRLVLHNVEQGTTTVVRSWSHAISFVAWTDDGGVVIGARSGQVSLVPGHVLRRQRRFQEVAPRLTDAYPVPVLEAVVAGDGRGRLYVIDEGTGQVMQETRAFEGPVLELAVNANGTRVAAVGEDRTLRVMQLPSLETTFTADVSWGVRCVRFAPNGSLLAAACSRADQDDRREGTFDVWDVRSGKVLQRLAGHTNWVTQLRFTTNGQRLFSLAIDETIRSWSLPDGQGRSVVDLSPFAQGTALHVSAEGKAAWVGHADGSVSRWGLDAEAVPISRWVAGDAVVAIESLPGTDALVVAAQSSPHLFVLEATTLQLWGQLPARVGNIRAVRRSACGRVLLVSGDAGVRVWPFADLP